MDSYFKRSFNRYATHNHQCKIECQIRKNKNEALLNFKCCRYQHEWELQIDSSCNEKIIRGHSKLVDCLYQANKIWEIYVGEINVKVAETLTGHCVQMVEIQCLILDSLEIISRRPWKLVQRQLQEENRVLSRKGQYRVITNMLSKTSESQIY